MALRVTSTGSGLLENEVGQWRAAVAKPSFPQMRNFKTRASGYSRGSFEGGAIPTARASG